MGDPLPSWTWLGIKERPLIYKFQATKSSNSQPFSCTKFSPRYAERLTAGLDKFSMAASEVAVIPNSRVPPIAEQISGLHPLGSLPLMRTSATSIDNTSATITVNFAMLNPFSKYRSCRLSFSSTSDSAHRFGESPLPL